MGYSVHGAADRAGTLSFTTLEVRLCSWLAAAAAAVAAAASIAVAQHEAGADPRLGKDSNCFADLDIMIQQLSMQGVKRQSLKNTHCPKHR